MTLQERILDALTDKAVTPRALYDMLKGEQPAAVDIAISALMKAGKVTRELGHYQRVNGRAAPAAATHASAPIVAAPPETTVLATVNCRTACDALTKRENEIYQLAESGQFTRSEIAEQLGISVKAVSCHLSNARGKLGVKGRVGRPERRAPVSAPSAAPQITAAPSHEGAGVATVGAEPPTSGVAKIDIPPLPQKFTISADLRARLFEQLREKAEEVQRYCGMLAKARQELSDIEEVLRVTTGEGTG